MKSTDALAQLAQFGKRIVTTSEAAVLWNMSLATTTKTLSRLATSGLLQEVCRGVWSVGTTKPDLVDVVPVLTRPYPSYVSTYSALFRHGMIDQIPRSLHVVSLGRSKRVATAFGDVVVHHLQPELFGGSYGGTSVRVGIASPEKALFDTVVVLSSRAGIVTLPEIELPETFDNGELQRWIERIPSKRVRTIANRNLKRILGLAHATTSD
jgi:predicted transcriptional regulator of viral defense system